MSEDFVPGRVRLFADSSALLLASSSISLVGPASGLCGPNCNSGIGGGDGSRGELAGDIAPLAGDTFAAMMSYLRDVECRPTSTLRRVLEQELRTAFA